MSSQREYKYYKIIRKEDNFTTYCTVLNYVGTFFKNLYGVPDKWIESDETTTIQVRKQNIEIPLRIKAVADDYEFDIVLSKQEYNTIQLRYL